MNSLSLKIVVHHHISPQVMSPVDSATNLISVCNCLPKDLVATYIQLLIHQLISWEIFEDAGPFEGSAHDIISEVQGKPQNASRKIIRLNLKSAIVLLSQYHF